MIRSEPITGPPTASGLLSVRGLRVGFATDAGFVHAVDELSFDVERGEVLSIVGESGSGKSTAALALIGLLPDGVVQRGTIWWKGIDLVDRPEVELQRIRGNEIAMVFQDASGALNALHSIGRQIGEALRIHEGVGRRAARDRAVQLLDLVGIPDAARASRLYPHECSGGMQQRAAIAMAIACGPDLLIADEPTTALDRTIEAQVLDVLVDIKDATGSAIVFITHDLGTVADISDRVMVMYGGRQTEIGTTAEVLSNPQHPYTIGLLDLVPELHEPNARPPIPIPGAAPSLIDHTAGCPFQPRCTFAQDRCSTDLPELLPLLGSHRSACHFPPPVSEPPAGSVNPLVPSPTARSTPSSGEDDGARPSHEAGPTNRPEGPPNIRAAVAGPIGSARRRHRGEPLLVATGLVKHYRVTSGLLGRKKEKLGAVAGVDLEVAAGETLGLVGESGCGKSTTGRMLVNLTRPTAGSVRFDGLDLGELSPREMRTQRRRLQFIFQNPDRSLNPRMRVGDALAEPLAVHHQMDASASRRHACELMELVGLSPDHARRFPHALSGGERQRVAIARALAVDPDLVVLDEPVSALDVSVRAGIVNLLADLSNDRNLALVFISHDLATVRQISDRVAVMYLGRVVEQGTSEQIFQNPSHPYTQALIAATPASVRTRESFGTREHPTMLGEIPSALHPPSGCAFRTRCEIAEPRCADQTPNLIPIGTGQTVACHLRHQA